MFPVETAERRHGLEKMLSLRWHLDFMDRFQNIWNLRQHCLGVTARMRACGNNFETGTFLTDSHDFAFCVFLLFNSKMVSETWKNIYYCYDMNCI